MTHWNHQEPYQKLLSSMTPTKEAKGQIGSSQISGGSEAFLGGVPLTTNVPYVPLGTFLFRGPYILVNVYYL